MRHQPHLLTHAYKVGIVGTGFIAAGLGRALKQTRDLKLSAILTRRDGSDIWCPPGTLLTRELDAFLDRVDVVVECSGDVIHTTNVVARAFQAGKPVVTMNSEWHITAGSYFMGKGRMTEARGDQGGSLAWLHDEAVEMGFTPKVYGNIKGFLNHTPTPEDMSYWAEKNGISIPQVTAFTDGTKVHIEQVHVANGLGVNIAKPGLLGPKTSTLKAGAELLAAAADELGQPIADYLLTPESPGGVFVVASHEDSQAASLAYMKLGEGPNYILIRPYHLCHIEIISTLRRFLGPQQITLLDNSASPVASVATVAKKALKAGDRLTRGAGSFEVRGSAVRIAEAAGHLPIGLVQNAILKRDVTAGEMLSIDDVEQQDTLALRAWIETEAAVLGHAPAASLTSKSIMRQKAEKVYATK